MEEYHENLFRHTGAPEIFEAEIFGKVLRGFTAGVSFFFFIAFFLRKEINHKFVSEYGHPTVELREFT